MALNLADRIAVRRVIVDRCVGAVANFALYLLGLPDGDGTGGTATAAQKAWARGAIADPATVGDRVSWYVLNQPEYIAGGSDITDAVLTGAVETAIRTHLIQG